MLYGIFSVNAIIVWATESYYISSSQVEENLKEIEAQQNFYESVMYSNVPYEVELPRQQHFSQAKKVTRNF